MNALLQSLLQLQGVTSDQANAIWRNLCYIVAGLLSACIIVFALNTLFGWHTPALILAMVFVPAAAFAWARPLFFVCVGIAGLAEKLASNATLAESLKDVFKAYSGVFKWATVAMVIYCFVMYFFALNVNSSMAVTALFALVVVGVCLWAWPELFPGAWARKTVYWGSVAVVICGLLSQIPAPYWIKYVGWAPSFAPTVTEHIVYDIRKAQTDSKEKSEDDILKQILKKVRDGNALTIAEESLVTKKEAEAKTVKALAGVAVDKLGDTGPSPSLATVDGWAKKYWLWIVLILAGLYFGFRGSNKPWAKAAQGMAIAVAIILAGTIAVHGIWGESSIPEKVSTLTAPANGKSPTIGSGKNGSSVTFSGKDFVGHCIYTDGRDEAYPCSTGDGLIKLYVHDTSGKENTVTYTRS